MTQRNWGRSGADMLWLAALVAGATYLIPVVTGWDGPAIVAWKGAGVALLALWIWRVVPGSLGIWFGMVLAFGSLGDILLDAVSLEVGAFAFALGHILAIGFYATQRRPAPTATQRALALAMPPLSLAIVWGLLGGQDGAWGAMVYTALVAIMASMAWLSRFSRLRTGIGAVFFLISDLLIFARLAGAVPTGAASIAIWALYFGGQALIARGVAHALSDEASAS